MNLQNRNRLIDIENELFTKVLGGQANQEMRLTDTHQINKSLPTVVAQDQNSIFVITYNGNEQQKNVDIYMLRCSVMSDCLQPHALQPARLHCLTDLPDKNIGVGYHFLLQEIFPTQESNLCLLLSRYILYHLGSQDKYIDTCIIEALCCIPEINRIL